MTTLSWKTARATLQRLVNELAALNSPWKTATLIDPLAFSMDDVYKPKLYVVTAGESGTQTFVLWPHERYVRAQSAWDYLIAIAGYPAGARRAFVRLVPTQDAITLTVSRIVKLLIDTGNKPKIGQAHKALGAFDGLQIATVTLRQFLSDLRKLDPTWRNGVIADPVEFNFPDVSAPTLDIVGEGVDRTNVVLWPHAQYVSAELAWNKLATSQKLVGADRKFIRLYPNQDRISTVIARVENLLGIGGFRIAGMSPWILIAGIVGYSLWKGKKS